MLFNCTVWQLMIRGTFVYLQPTCPPYSLFSHLFQVFTWLSFIYKYEYLTHTLLPSSVSTAAHYRHRLSVVFSVDNLNTSMQTLLHHDCWRVCLCGDSSTDFTSDRADLSGAVGGKKGFCASPRVFFFFFFPVTLSGPRTMIFMSNMSSQLTSG